MSGRTTTAINTFEPIPDSWASITSVLIAGASC